jgi:hypothetical protein
MIKEGSSMHKLFQPYADRIFANDPATKKRILEDIEKRKEDANKKSASDKNKAVCK